MEVSNTHSGDGDDVMVEGLLERGDIMEQAVERARKNRPKKPKKEKEAGNDRIADEATRARAHNSRLRKEQNRHALPPEEIEEIKGSVDRAKRNPGPREIRMERLTLGEWWDVHTEIGRAGYGPWVVPDEAPEVKEQRENERVERREKIRLEVEKELQEERQAKEREEEKSVD
jgi:hypothetical protein